MTMTHEQYINSIVQHVIDTAQDSDKARLIKAKIVYGTGQPGLRGVTYYDKWESCDGNHIDLVEICAFGQSSPVQVAGTIIHELAHVVSGLGVGHGKEWKDACSRLGLRLAKAAGMNYLAANLRADVRELIDSILPQDGKPLFTEYTGRTKACPMGIGTRGGKSRGLGSGSRMLKLECVDCGAVWRMSSKWLVEAGDSQYCPVCGSHKNHIV